MWMNSLPGHVPIDMSTATNIIVDVKRNLPSIINISTGSVLSLKPVVHCVVYTEPYVPFLISNITVVNPLSTLNPHNTSFQLLL